MNKNQRGFANIILVIIVVGTIVVSGGYFFLSNKSISTTKKITYGILISNLENLNYKGNTPQHSKDGINKDIFNWNKQYLILDKHCYSGDLNISQYRECDKLITIIYQRPDPKFKIGPLEYNFDLKRCVYTPQPPYQDKCGKPYLLNNGLY